MRHLLLGLVFVSAPAFADPTSYVQGGFEAGVNDGFLTAGGNVEAGAQVTPGVWVHAVATHGGAAELFSQGHGRYTQARGGVDLVGCGPHGTSVCTFVSLDAGVQHVSWTGIEGSLFDSNTDNSMTVTKDHVRPIAVGRAGLDVGGTHVRWRPSLELAVSDHGANGLNLMQSLAYRW